jgi:diacylglycerol kinase (ATP)
VLIVNTRSRRGREWFSEAQTVLRELGVELESAKTFRTIQELTAEASSAIRRKVPLVIAGGGDGTFSAIARYFVGSDSVLGVLPLGTGNAFARDLGIPAELPTACAVVAQGRTATVDLGTAAGDYFLNVATVGVTSLIARALTDESKRRLGRFVYAVALIRALKSARPFRLVLETENGTAEFETLQLVVGNGRYHAGPFPLSPDASITEGKLSLYALHTTSKAAFLKLGLYLPFGRQVDLPEVHHQETIGGRITTHPALPATIDGEVCARTPFRFGIEPDCLRVMVPPDFSG